MKSLQMRMKDETRKVHSLVDKIHEFDPVIDSAVTVVSVLAATIYRALESVLCLFACNKSHAFVCVVARFFTLVAERRG